MRQKNVAQKNELNETKNVAQTNELNATKYIKIYLEKYRL